MWACSQGNIIYEKYHDRGGHFTSFEPEASVEDLRFMSGPGGGERGSTKSTWVTVSIVNKPTAQINSTKDLFKK
jgi:hypothetical protein